MAVSESIARPARGAGQGGVAYLAVDCLDEFTGWDPTTRQYGLAVLALSVVVSFVQNLGENRGWWKAVLRSVPPTEVPVTDDLDTDAETDTETEVGPVDSPPKDGVFRDWDGAQHDSDLVAEGNRIGAETPDVDFVETATGKVKSL